ncbi:MAG TPA: hypothetical protein VMV92_07805, partial [Streptosporangiaceae bacterium]|nr:hypothetical protein [Streptosporangiaceae bacterium]
MSSEAESATRAVAGLQTAIDALHGKDVHIGVGIAGMSAAGAGAGGEAAAARAAAAAVDELATADWRMNAASQLLVDISNSVADSFVLEAAASATVTDAYAAQARTAGLLAGEAGLAGLDAVTLAAGNTAAASTAKWNGLWGALGRIGSAKISLFGGIAGTVGGVHLLVDAIAEIAIVATGAAAAMAAFGIAAGPSIEAIKNQMTNLQTVTEATGRTLYPMTGEFQAMAAAVKPQVYQLFGDALNIAAHNGAGFTRMAAGTGAVLDQLAARFTVAVTSGNTFGIFLRNAVSDVAKLGDIVGNLGGILGTVFRVMPGYAQVLLNVADGVSKVAESAVSMAAPVIGAGLALHGAWLYAGLGVTVLSAAVRGGLTVVGNFAEKAAMAAADSSLLGGALSKAAPAMFGLAAGAADAAALPWGWIMAAAAGVGVLVYALVSAKDATQQWLGSLQQTLAAAPAAQGLTAIMTAQAAVANRLATTQTTLAHTTQYLSQVNLHTGQSMQVLNPAYQQAQRSASELTHGQQILADQTRLYDYRLGKLAGTYGGTAVASGLLAAAGIKLGDMVTYGSVAWARIQAQVAATDSAYRAMGQTGGTLGADMTVLNRLISDQYVQMTKLNQAWTTFLAGSTGLVTGINAVIAGMRTMHGQAKAAGASFTGVNNASLTLQNTFEQNVTTLQGVIGGMRLAGSSAHAMAQVISTALIPSVHKGALANAGLRTQIYDMAREAGYAGPNQIAALTHWIDRNATSLHRMATNARGASARTAGVGSTARTTTTDLSKMGSETAKVATALAHHQISAKAASMATFMLHHDVTGLSSAESGSAGVRQALNTHLQQQGKLAATAATNTQHLGRQVQMAGSNAGTASGKMAALATDIGKVGSAASTAARAVAQLATAISGLQSKTITL